MKKHRGKYNSAKTGKYFVLNKEKYTGNCTPIYKSELEHKMMIYLDKSPHIISWSYEGLSIKYLDTSSKPERVRNYHIDFVAYAKTKNGIKKLWIEVKDSRETQDKKPNPKNIMECKTWLKNRCKWKQAEITARQNNAEFKIITEKELD